MLGLRLREVGLVEQGDRRESEESEDTCLDKKSSRIRSTTLGKLS